MKLLTALTIAASLGAVAWAAPLDAAQKQPAMPAYEQLAQAQPAPQQQPRAQQQPRPQQPAAQPKPAAPAAAPAGAEEGEKIVVKIAVLDMDTIRRDAGAAKDIREQINKYRTSFQTAIQKEEDELRNANQELARQRTILSPEAFAAERKKFEDRLVEVQRLVQKRKDDLEKSFNDAMRIVNDSLNDIVVELANQEALTLIIRRDQTVLVAKALEITPVVLDRLNKKLPKVKVADPSAADAPAPKPAVKPAPKPAK